MELLLSYSLQILESKHVIVEIRRRDTSSDCIYNMTNLMVQPNSRWTRLKIRQRRREEKVRYCVDMDTVLDVTVEKTSWAHPLVIHRHN